MSQYQFAPLLSDYLVYAMLLAAIGLGVAAHRSPANRAALRQIASRDVPAAAGVVLVAFLIIGLLDSIHLREPLADTPSDQTHRYHMEAQSLLDLLLRDLRARTETSYSAPFALYGFSKEMTFDENGEALWRYPRLTHAGDGIDDPDQHTGDILRRVITATAAGSLLCALVVCLSCTLLARRWRLPF
ncbi:MAG: ABC transporter permease, partial [Pseudomonadota bacterium]|nr:ABC transporter permease [Pseudomonadota bacterium]